MSLPFKTPKPKKAIKIGDKEVGEVEVPVYEGLLVGEGIEVSRLLQRVARELGKPPQEITDEDLVAYKPDLALIVLRYRVKGGEEATPEYVNSLPWRVVQQLADLLLAEIIAENLQRLEAVVEEEGEEGEAKKAKSQPPS